MNKPPNLPTSFLSTSRSSSVVVQPARFVEVVPEPVKRPGVNQHSGNSLLSDRRVAGLSVSRPRHRPGRREDPARITLSKEMLRALPQLGPESPVDVVPPQRRGGTWHLDTRPTAPGRLPKIIGSSSSCYFRTAHRLGPEHFLRSAGVGQPVEQRECLYFRLGPEMPGQPGYYTLLPG